MGLDFLSGQSIRPKQFRDGVNFFRNDLSNQNAKTYDRLSNASLVNDSGPQNGWLELTKNAQKTYVVQNPKTPLSVGQFLEISFRVRHVAGALATARVCALPFNDDDVLQDLPQQGRSYDIVAGAVTEITAVVGAGSRDGVDLAWGNQAGLANFGLLMEGPNNGVFQIEPMQIKDVSGTFLAQNADWVDVRDFGAVGDGSQDNADAFIAADKHASGRTVLVPEGTYKIDRDVTLNSPVRFIGKLKMGRKPKLMLTHNFDYERYCEAFDDEVSALKKALQALYNFTDHDSLDLRGRRVELSEPLDVHEAVDGVDRFVFRRVLRNGKLFAAQSARWQTGFVEAKASYDKNDSKTLFNVENIENIEIGAVVSGQGVGREVFVIDKNNNAGTVTLSNDLHSAETSQTYVFRRFRYLLDFSGFENMSRIELEQIEMRCEHRASGLILAKTGIACHITHCWFEDTLDRAITSYNLGCNGLCVETCEFRASDRDLAPEERGSIGISTHKNDMKIRNNRGLGYRHFAVLGGTGHIFMGNHIFQGSPGDSPSRTASLVFANKRTKATMTGNYIDNSFVEITNERDVKRNARPNDEPFGLLTMVGNIFTCNDVADWFRYLVVTPYGDNHTLGNFSVIGNTFGKEGAGTFDRVEGVNTSNGSIDHSKTTRMRFYENNFSGVNQETCAPLDIEVGAANAKTSWTQDVGSYMPFGGIVQRVTALAPNGKIENGSGNTVTDIPYAVAGTGAQKTGVTLKFKTASKGTYSVTVASDAPRG